MANSLPSPPLTSTTTESTPEPSSTIALSARLDTLLEQYLDLLDTYTTLRASLSQHLSSGFFSLAQAQRSSTLGSGRRYGEECYDERMKAGRGVQIRSESSDDGEGEESRRGRGDAQDQRDEQKTSEGTNVESEDEKGEAKETENESSAFEAPTTTTSSSKPLPLFTIKTLPSTAEPSINPNPIRMFSPLPPTTLRAAQTSFSLALTTSIPALLNTSHQMQELEDKVEMLRAELVLLQAEEDGDVEGDAKVDDGVEEEDDDDNEELEQEINGLKLMKQEHADVEVNVRQGKINKTKPSTTTMRKGDGDGAKSHGKNKVSKTSATLPVSRAVEPRSRVLKVD